MKLLLDQNLSPRLVSALADLYPGSAHLQDVGLDRASDVEVWTYALKNSYVVVSKDSDFNERAMLYGSPPKVIWIRRGNCNTQQIEQILRHAYADAVLMEATAIEGLLELF
jgi:predicted nuclease of predicted toxin-antitoxin system